MDWALLASIFMVGLLSSSAHCVGMCGGIMGALTMAIPTEARAKRWQLLISYNLGRISTYAFIGFIAGYAASWFDHWGASIWLRWLAGFLLIAMGLYIANWWRGLIYLEAAGRYFWAYIQPLGKALLPVKSATRALLLGAIWGWLPCGLVYSALGTALAQAQPLESALVMAAFGLGTLPMVLAAGLAANLLAGLLRNVALRSLMGLLIIGFGVWTIYGVGFGHGHSHGAVTSSSHQDHSTADQMTPPPMDHAVMDHSAMDNMEAMDMGQGDEQPMEMTDDAMAAMGHQHSHAIDSEAQSSAAADSSADPAE